MEKKIVKCYVIDDEAAKLMRCEQVIDKIKEEIDHIVDLEVGFDMSPSDAIELCKDPGKIITHIAESTENDFWCLDLKMEKCTASIKELSDITGLNIETLLADLKEGSGITNILPGYHLSITLAEYLKKKEVNFLFISTDDKSGQKIANYYQTINVPKWPVSGNSNNKEQLKDANDQILDYIKNKIIKDVFLMMDEKMFINCMEEITRTEKNHYDPVKVDTYKLIDPLAKMIGINSHAVMRNDEKIYPGSKCKIVEESFKAFSKRKFKFSYCIFHCLEYGNLRGE